MRGTSYAWHEVDRVNPSSLFRNTGFLMYRSVDFFIVFTAFFLWRIELTGPLSAAHAVTEL